MNVLSPAVLYIIAIILMFAGTAATVAFFRGDQPDWIALSVGVSGIVIAFGLVITLPAAPPVVLQVAPYFLGCLLLFDAVRRAVRRRRGQRRTSRHRQNGPPDIENIP